MTPFTPKFITRETILKAVGSIVRCERCGGERLIRESSPKVGVCRLCLDEMALLSDKKYEKNWI